MFRVRSRNRKTGAVPVYLNVYDLTSINVYGYWLGLGVFHSGVEVHGMEYAYGAHERATSGIFEGQPQQHCARFAFRKSILIGRTDLGPLEVRALIATLAAEYAGNTYSLVSKNCNHFCNDLCLRLTDKPIPRWVNRLANIGFLCSCVLPLHVPVDGNHEDEAKRKREEEEERKLKSKSTRIPPPTYTPAAYSETTKSHGGKRCSASTSSIVGVFPNMTV